VVAVARKPKFGEPTAAPLHDRGSRLYELLAPAGSDLAQQAVALEAARMADRLDALNAAIEGDGVLELMRFRVRGALSEEGVVSVDLHVDGLLSEARQTAAAFERVLRAARAGVDLTTAKAGGSGGVDELAQRRTAERAARGVKA
jgi:uncharacterized protein (DUF2126 family)